MLGDNQYEHGERELPVRLARRGARFAPQHPALPGGTNTRRSRTRRGAGVLLVLRRVSRRPGGLLPLAARRLERVRAQLGRDQLDAREGGNPSLPDDCWPVSCAAGSEQEQWLSNELAGTARRRVRDLLASPALPVRLQGVNQPHPETAPLFADLYEAGAELLLTGHSHNYERFAPLTPDGCGSPRPEAVRGGHGWPQPPHRHGSAGGKQRGASDRCLRGARAHPGAQRPASSARTAPRSTRPAEPATPPEAG